MYPEESARRWSRDLQSEMQAAADTGQVKNKEVAGFERKAQQAQYLLTVLILKRGNMAEMR